MSFSNKKEWSIDAMTSRDPENTHSVKEAGHKGPRIILCPLIGNVQKKQIYRDKSRSEAA